MMAKLFAGEVALGIFVAISYKDVFGKPHNNVQRFVYSIDQISAGVGPVSIPDDFEES